MSKYLSKWLFSIILEESFIAQWTGIGILIWKYYIIFHTTGLLSYQEPRENLKKAISTALFCIFFNYLDHFDTRIQAILWPMRHFFGYGNVIPQKVIPIGLQGTL
jgi:hypothetical protein